MAPSVPAKTMLSLSQDVYGLQAAVRRLQRDGAEQLELEKETQVGNTIH